ASDLASVGGVGTLTVTQADTTSFTGNVAATTVTLTDTNSTITFGGDLTATTLNTAAQTYSVALNGTATTITNDVTFLNTGGVALGNGAADVLLFNGGLDTTAGATTAFGSVRTSGDQMDVGALTLAGNTTLDTTNNGGTAAGAVLNVGAVTGATFNLASSEG